ncbi:MAG: 6-phosphofructokinase [Lachnospiraceae bacterium]|nr:6-phosphofructokinase [Lachnospiraceae bacterium]
MKGNVLVGQSGGPTTVINASLAGVLGAAFNCEQIDTVYGMVNGIQGVINDHIIDLTKEFKGNEKKLEQLRITPSMFLGSCRYKLKDPAVDVSDMERVFEILKKYNIRYFLYIGGNDSMDTVNKVSKYAKENGYDIQVIGIPKTIDNDLMEIDHTPGFGSAAKYIATSVLEMAHDTYIYYMQSVLIVEIMGRNAGWLTAASVLARNSYNAAPHLIYLPESNFSTEQFIADIKEQLKQRKQVIVAVSEGIHDENGEYISAKSTKTDQFGHVMLSGNGKYLESLVQKEIGCKVRSVELNVLQRCAAHISSATDVSEAFHLGEKAVDAVLNGRTDEMTSLQRISNDPYVVEYTTVPVSKVANKEKKIPREWINEAGNDVKQELVDYLKPLIEGELKMEYNQGIPNYIKPVDID